jgi:hypothetical protein
MASLTSIEAGTISFSNTDTATVTFSITYASAPYVIITPPSNVNAYIEILTASQLTVGLSEKITGDVNFQVLATS